MSLSFPITKYIEVTVPLLYPLADPVDSVKNIHGRQMLLLLLRFFLLLEVKLCGVSSLARYC